MKSKTFWIAAQRHTAMTNNSKTFWIAAQNPAAMTGEAGLAPTMNN